MKNPTTVRIVIIIFAAVLLVSIFSSSIFFTVGNGERAIMFEPFSGGLDKDEVIGEGLHVKLPWNRSIIYNVKKKQREEVMDVLSSNGLSIAVDISMRYRPIEAQIGFLHNEIGPDYVNTIVIPEIRAAARKVIGKYTPEELYSSKREVIQQEILEKTSMVLADNHIDLDALLIRSIKLPPAIKTAIESKLQQEQKSQEYEFRIVAERKEAERKKIEAQGIQDFQEIVTQGISDKLLRWKGIEATEKLSKSPNAKVIVVGSGKDGLPIILGQ